MNGPSITLDPNYTYSGDPYPFGMDPVSKTTDSSTMYCLQHITVVIYYVWARLL